MREIKFRAWHAEWRMMLDVPSIDFAYNLVYIQPLGDNSGVEEIGLDEVELIQYTGLEDCSGAEIYDGDILEGFDNRFIVKFGNIKFKKVAPNGSINKVEMACFYFEDVQGNPLFPIVNNYKGEHDMQSLKIIGNIYENPELLEGIGK